MNRQSPLLYAAIAAIFAILTGCHPQQPFYFNENKNASPGSLSWGSNAN